MYIDDSQAVIFFTFHMRVVSAQSFATLHHANDLRTAWAHRTLIVRKLKGLEDILRQCPVSISSGRT